jgi:RND superfamily putative drug exporter
MKPVTRADNSQMRNLATWCFEHRRTVLAAWLAALVALTLVHRAVGSDFRDTFKLPGTESAEALSLLQQASPKAGGDTEQIVIAVDRGDVEDPRVRERVEQMLARIAAIPYVAFVTSPYSAEGKTQISPDRRIAYATVNLTKQAIDVSADEAKRLVAVAQKAQDNGLRIELGGQAIEAADPPGSSGTGPAFVMAAIVLLLVFGSLFAAALPLATAAVSLGVGIALIGLLSHVMTTASFSTDLSLLIGLGVGVDYSLFIVTRYRQARMRGSDGLQATREAMNTSGRAVLFAGTTVCIALLGMFTLGVSFLYGAAVATCVVVACTVTAALTLLPAMLGFFGHRVLTRKQRHELSEGRYGVVEETGAWASWSRHLAKHPALYATAGILVMFVIASPLLSLDLGASDQGNDPSDTTTRQAYDLLAKGFGPGFNGPLMLIAKLDDKSQAEDFDKLMIAVERTPGVVAATPGAVTGGQDGRPAVIVSEVIPRGSPQSNSTSDLITKLRDDVIPVAARDSGLNVLVGGETAIADDFAHVLAGKLFLFIGIVVTLSVFLLMIVFRSIIVPLTAAAMNLISVSAAFGVIVAIFQWGWFAELLGVTRPGPVDAFIPVMVFAILFGLSMDYEVFLVSRIREEWDRRGDNREAVCHGLAATGRTITAAAAIMVLVFAAFAFGDNRIIKLFGIGLASAVLLDAVVVRSLIMPGLMIVIGKANWWLPRFLDRRLPHLDVEGHEPEPQAVSS